MIKADTIETSKKVIAVVCLSGESENSYELEPIIIDKMREAATKEGLNWDIFGVGLREFKDKTQQADVILLTPAVRFARTSILAQKTNPCAVIDNIPFSMFNTVNALNSKEELISYVKELLEKEKSELNNDRQILSKSNDVKNERRDSFDKKGKEKVLIDVFSPMNQEDIKNLLTSNEKPKFVYVKNINNVTMQFKATHAEEIIDVATYTKRLIQAQHWGKSLLFRVTTAE